MLKPFMVTQKQKTQMYFSKVELNPLLGLKTKAFSKCDISWLYVPAEVLILFKNQEVMFRSHRSDATGTDKTVHSMKTHSDADRRWQQTINQQTMKPAPTKGHQRQIKHSPDALFPNRAGNRTAREINRTLPFFPPRLRVSPRDNYFIFS